MIEFGPPNATMHKRDEAVALDDLEALARIYRRIAIAALTGDSDDTDAPRSAYEPRSIGSRQGAWRILVGFVLGLAPVRG